jgi:hypothetical protein
MIGRLSGFFAILAGALAAVGAFPAWVTLNSGDVTSGYNAFNIIGDYRDAIITFVLAAVLLVAGFLLTARPMFMVRGLGALAGVAATLWAAVLFFSLVPSVHALIAPSSSSASGSIGLGLWVIAGAGLFGLVAALTAAMARPRRVVRVPAEEPAAPARTERAPATAAAPPAAPAAEPRTAAPAGHRTAPAPPPVAPPAASGRR